MISRGFQYAGGAFTIACPLWRRGSPAADTGGAGTGIRASVGASPDVISDDKAVARMCDLTTRIFRGMCRPARFPWHSPACMVREVLLSSTLIRWRNGLFHEELCISVSLHGFLQLCGEGGTYQASSPGGIQEWGMHGRSRDHC